MDSIGVAIDKRSKSCLVACEPAGRAVEGVEGPVIAGGVCDNSIVDWESKEETGCGIGVIDRSKLVRLMRTMTRLYTFSYVIA
jgi:hypothetical protein